MKVCFLIRSLDVGGAERQVVQLAPDLKERGHQVRVVTYYPGGQYERQLISSGVPLVCLEKRGRWHVFSFLWVLWREIQSQRPDVVYSFLTSSNILIALLSGLLSGVRIVWGVRVSNMDLAAYGILVRLLSVTERLLARVPQMTIANSKAGVACCLRRGFPKTRIAYISNGIDLDLFRPEPASRAALRQLLGMELGTPIIGMIARYDPMKGVEVFLDAAVDLARQNSAVHFLLVGTGMDAANHELVEAINIRGLTASISLLGPRDDIAPVLAGLDIATLSSCFGEGFPNVIGEAMACGIPIVATDVGDAADIIGSDGWTVAPGDWKALSDAWQDALDLPPETLQIMAAAGRARIFEQFERRAIAAQTETVLFGCTKVPI